LAKLDATDEANAAIAQEYKIKGFPTMKVFRKGDATTPSDYQGPRTADGMVDWLQEVRPPCVPRAPTKLKQHLDANDGRHTPRRSTEPNSDRLDSDRTRGEVPVNSCGVVCALRSLTPGYQAGDDAGVDGGRHEGADGG
jgi:hypothetical protein